MYIYIHIYICIYVCVYAYAYVYVYVSVYACRGHQRMARVSFGFRVWMGFMSFAYVYKGLTGHFTANPEPEM